MRPRRAGAGRISESGNIGKLKPRATQHAHGSIEARDKMARANRRENAGIGGSWGESEGISARPKSPEGIRADKPTPEGQRGRGLIVAPPAMCAPRALFAGGIGRRPEVIAPPPLFPALNLPFEAVFQCWRKPTKKRARLGRNRSPKAPATLRGRAKRGEGEAGAGTPRAHDRWAGTQRERAPSSRGGATRPNEAPAKHIKETPAKHTRNHSTTQGAGAQEERRAHQPKEAQAPRASRQKRRGL